MVMMNDLEEVKMLLELGMVDVNVKNLVEGVMVLYGVVYEGNVECV